MEEKKGENLNKENFVRINFCCPSFEGVSSPRIVNWLANPQEIELTEEILNNFRKEINAYSFGIAPYHKRSKKLGYFDRAGRDDSQRTYAQRQKIYGAAKKYEN